MALDAATAQEMIRKLADDRTKYLDTLTRAHDVLAQALNAAAIGTPVSSLTTDSVNQNAGLTADGESGEPNSNFSIDESETDDDESLFVRQTLPQEQYELDGLREHVRLYEWTQSGRDILGDMLDERQPPGESNIFPNQPGELEGRSHLPHYSIFDVGDDGVPLPIRNARNSSPCSRAAAIWKNIKVLV